MHVRLWISIANNDIEVDRCVEKWVEEAQKLAKKRKPKTSDDIKEILNDIELNTDDDDLRDWLGESDNALNYLMKAVSEHGPGEGFQMLSIAQKMVKTDVYRITLEWLIAKEEEKKNEKD